MRARAGSTRSNFPAETHRNQQQVSPGGLGQRFVEGLRVVSSSGQNPRLPARGSHHSGQHGALELRIWPGAGDDPTETSSSPVVRDGDAGPDEDLQGAVATGRGQGNLSKVKRGSGG